MAKIRVVEGEVTAIKTDAVVAVINPKKCVGKLHEQIKSRSGNLFHALAEAEMPLRSGQVLYVEALIPHGGLNKSVIFVADESKSVYKVVSLALAASTKYKVASVCIPTFDADVSDLLELAKAIADFIKTKPPIEEIIIVVSNSDDKFILDDELWRV